MAVSIFINYSDSLNISIIHKFNLIDAKKLSTPINRLDSIDLENIISD